MLFLILAVTNPGTTITIDDTRISRSGTLFGGSLPFNEIASATVERDLDAQNFKQMVIKSRGGGTLLIDPRFLNPDIDGLVDLLRGRFREHGIELVTEHTTAEQTPKIGFGSPGTYRLLDRPRLESPAAEDLPLRNRFTVKRQ